MATTVLMNALVMPKEAVGAKFSDTLDIDQHEHLLYLGDNWSGGIDVFDIATAQPKFLETLRVRGNIYGVCVAAPVGKLYVGLLPSAVAIFDITPGSPTKNTLLSRIDTGGRGHSDLLDFDPLHEKVYVANRNDGFVVVIDAGRDEIVGHIDGLGPGLEQPRFNAADGMVYVTGNGNNVLYQIDPERDELVGTLEIGVPSSPNGLAINPTTNQALLAGSDRAHPNTVIYDLGSRSVAEVIEGCGCGDGAIYSAAADRFFFAASSYPDGPVVGIFGGQPVDLISAVASHPRSSWVAFDETNETVYLPAVIEGRPALTSFRLDDVPEHSG